MDLLYVFTQIYTKLNNRKGMPNWVLTPFRKSLRLVANKILPIYLSKSQNKRNINVEKDVIVSFTSFPARINSVWLVVETLKRQSILPEKIFLYLSKQQFPTQSSIPSRLWSQQDERFSICLVDGDIRSHKKYYYAMRDYPNKTIVTCDDDIFYHPKMLQFLLEARHMCPDCVIANVCKQIKYSVEGIVLPYSQWSGDVEEYANENIVQIGVGGVLYPPMSLDKRVLEVNLFSKLTPTADDLWLYYMAKENNTTVVKSKFKYLPLPVEIKAPSLSSVNVCENQNDVQIRNLNVFFNESKH